MANFLSDDDPFPIIPGVDALFSLTSPLPPTPAAADSMNTSTHSNNSNPRKRQRTSASFSKGPGGNVKTHTPGSTSETQTPVRSPHLAVASLLDGSELVAKLKSENPNDIIEALNFLLLKSADHEINYALGRDGHKVMDALVELYDETIGWTRGNDNWLKDDKDADIPSAKTWEKISSPSAGGNKSIDELDWECFCATKFAPSTLNTAFTPSHIMPAHLMNEENDKDGIRICEMILLILRNLSYVQANTRFILQSIGILRILVGSLYFRNFMTGKEVRGPKVDRDDVDADNGNSSSNMCLHAINAFYNLAPNLDVTGEKIFLDFHLLDGTLDVTQVQTKTSKTTDTVDIKSYVDADKCGKIHGMGMVSLQIAKNFNIKDEKLTKLPDNMFRPVVKQYVKASMAIFPAFYGLLRVRTSRAVVIGSLEALILMVDNQDNKSIFLHTPDTILHQLVHLLWIPRLGPDSIEYVDPLRNAVSRVSGMKLLGGYDIAVDYEVRDRSVEILQKLTDMSDDLKRRVGRKFVVSQTDDFDVNVVRYAGQLNTRLYDAILPALTTKVGRDHTSQFAAKLLSNLSSVEDNLNGIRYIERKLLRAMDNVTPVISHIISNKILSCI